MKLKELPSSLARSWSLQAIPVSKLTSTPEIILKDCIVSLTSIPSRLRILPLTVRSLLSQSSAPEKVVLWLNESLESSVPRSLRRLVSERFELRYSDQSCPHRKLIETLKVYPEKTIVTCDDDVMYEKDWLSLLWEAHVANPSDIVAHECRSIQYVAGEAKPYSEWHDEVAGEALPGTLAIGYGGTLYPKNSLFQDVCDRHLYAKLAPRADDLWFKAMSLLQGTHTRKVASPAKKPTPIVFSQRISLKKYNILQDGNLLQWRQLDAHYNLKDKLLE